jgi:hypothetical protein
MKIYLIVETEDEYGFIAEIEKGYTSEEKAKAELAELSKFALNREIVTVEIEE